MFDSLQIFANFILIPAYIIAMNKAVPTYHQDQYYRDFMLISSACLFTYSFVASLDKTINIFSDCFMCSV